MPNNEIRDIEQKIHTLMERLAKLQQSNRGNEVITAFLQLKVRSIFWIFLEKKINYCYFIIWDKVVAIVHFGQMGLMDFFPI